MSGTNDNSNLKITNALANRWEHFLENDYKGDRIHIDYETAPGAKIKTLEQMFRQSYGEEKRGMDVLLIGGLNDFKFDSNSLIMKKIRDFNLTVKRQADLHHPDNPSTFRVATFIMAPQFCWFPDNGPLPNPDYENRIEKQSNPPI